VWVPDRSGRPQHFVHVLSDKEVQDGIRSFRHFPALAEDLTSGRASVRYEIRRVERGLTSLTHMDEDMYWPSPTDTREEIDLLAAPGTCDSIFVLWPQHNFRDGTSVRDPAGRLATLEPASLTNLLGWSMINSTPAELQCSTFTKQEVRSSGVAGGAISFFRDARTGTSQIEAAGFRARKGDT
jgi:hypothetical protein